MDIVSKPLPSSLKHWFILLLISNTFILHILRTCFWLFFSLLKMVKGQPTRKSPEPFYPFLSIYKSHSEHLVGNHVHKQCFFQHQFVLIIHKIYMRKQKNIATKSLRIFLNNTLNFFLVSFGMFCTSKNLGFGFTLSKNHG